MRPVSLALLCLVTITGIAQAAHPARTNLVAKDQAKAAQRFSPRMQTAVRDTMSLGESALRQNGRKAYGFTHDADGRSTLVVEARTSGQSVARTVSVSPGGRVMSATSRLETRSGKVYESKQREVRLPFGMTIRTLDLTSPRSPVGGSRRIELLVGDRSYTLKK